MEIERILKFKTTKEDMLGMILSNNIDIMHNGDACISIRKWNQLVIEILAWHENELNKQKR